MAITIDDFSKIWASTSPLTPYAFSDSHYQEGWNFIGATPPSRQMWDFLQKNNDEKMQYLANNYLPLSGGTMTGRLKTSSDIGFSRDNGRLSLNGGDTSGAYLNMYGKDHGTWPGLFSLAASDGQTTNQLQGAVDGTLKWKNYNVLTNETVGTVVSQKFTSTTTLSANTATDLGSITLSAGTWVVTGHVRFATIIAGRQFIAINDNIGLNAGTEGCVVHSSDTASGATLSLSTTRIFVLSSTKTIYLLGFASASCDAGADNHLTAVRII